MDVKALYKRFRAWQKEPFKYDRLDGKVLQCANCGTSFEGKYCPVCGQSAGVGKVDWKSVDKDVKSILKVDDAENFFPFLIQLFGRTGYLISDYISGRRKVCSSPVGRLCLIAIAAMLVQSKTVNSASEEISFLGSTFSFLEKNLQWLSANLSWAILIQTALQIIPTWMLFRFAPKHTKHTIPEGIYIQVFMSSLVIVFVLLRCLAGDWILVFIPIFYIIAYRALFGYGVWGTIWRTLLSIGIVFYFFGVAIAAVKCLQGDLILVNSVWGSLVIIAALLAAGVGILFLGYRIGKRTACSKTEAYDRSRSV